MRPPRVWDEDNTVYCQGGCDEAHTVYCQRVCDEAHTVYCQGGCDEAHTVYCQRVCDEAHTVGHVQRVSLKPDSIQEMKTLSLKPLLFEIPGFLSEEECGVVVQLAQLKGLMESQATVPPENQEEELQPLLSLSPEETFSLLDLDQDGLLQRQEILSHSRSRDGTWLSPENLRQILTGQEASPAGVLTLEEFRHVCDGMSQHPLQQRGGTRRGQPKRKSRHTWLYQGPGSHHILHALRNRVTHLARLPSPLVELSEPLQVIRYEQGGFSHAHHDSSPSHPETTCSHTRLAGNTSAHTEISCRYITVFLYLNSVEGGGETTFPVADNRTYEEEALVQGGVDLTDTQQSCNRGNLRVKPTAGTALLWYNHLSDGKGWMGEVDEYSLHGDCPVTRGVKWVANSWVNVDPDHQRQARYQRLVTHRQEGEPGREEREPPPPHSNHHQDL
ncbi:transmembrane prolyl 4-hydroxylase-like isoform X2 [Oncorhynchus keta]|uniref:transmembrane prolyl 4-hydroxylase-like isoform X2 n=1 Tax=Oncorhynchus keta TaxID=8018 RepID=UPI00227D5BFA|nr:transmembrane prolyl 4-hydroxylase-like isoform X2 [Oncorhynchus keta]